MNIKQIRIAGVILLLISVGIFMTGCLEKQRAEYNQSSAEKILFKAKDMEAQKYVKSDYDIASTAIEEVKKDLSRGDAIGALDASKRAKTAAQQAFENARSRKGEEDFATAEKKATVATNNEGKRSNPKLYQQIQDNLDQARKYHTRSTKNYDQIIKYSDLVIDDVKTLLAEVTKQAGIEVTEAQTILDDAKRNEAETRVPDAWSKATSMVNEAVQLKNQEAYFRAIEKAKEAQTVAKDADTLAMQSKASEEIQNAEKLIAALKDVDAPTYTKQDYGQIEGNFLRAQQAFLDKDYRIAIDVARIVEARAPAVLATAGKLKLRDQLDIAKKDIDTLKLNDAEKYAPEFLSQAEALVEDAEKAFNNEEYERVKTIHEQIRNKIDLANERLRVRAEDQIREADNAIKDAEDASSLLYSGEILKRAQDMRDDSQKLLDNKQFRDSILTAQNTIVKAQEAKTEAIKRKADLALIDAEKRISVAVGDGAQLYAVEDIQEARDLLKQGRDAWQGGQYSKAQDLTTQIQNKVDDSYTTMRKKAVAQIDEARKAIDNASEERYMITHYPTALQTLSIAQQKMADAEALLNDKKFARAIESGVDSRGTAVDAKNTAIRLQIADRKPAVLRQIEEAKLAGAYVYAIEEYDKSLANLKAVDDNLAAGKYDLALDNIDGAEQHAEAALKGQIIKARNLIESAKSIGAWNHDPASLQSAVMQLDAAETALKVKHYPESLAEANASIAAATLAQSNTRDGIFMGEIGQINQLLANAKIANALIPEKVADIKLKTAAVQADYQSNKDKGDRFTTGMEALAKLKTEAANLDTEAKAKQDELTKQIETAIAAAKQAEVEKYAENELTKAEESYRIADAAYKRQDYAAAKAAYDLALAALKEVETRRQEKEYKDAIGVQLARLNKAMADFGEVLVLSPNNMKDIKDWKVQETYAETPQFNFHNVVTLSPNFFQASIGDVLHDPYKGIQKTLTAGKFRQITTETYVRIKALKPPPTLKEFHNTVLRMFEEAKLAGEFFDKFGYYQTYTPETRDSMIDSAFQHIKRCWQLKNEVDTFLQGPKAKKTKPDTFWNWAFASNKETPAGESFWNWVKGN